MQRPIIIYFQALYKAKAIDPNNSQIFLRIVDLSSKDIPDENCPADVKEVIMTLTSSLLEDKTVTEFVCDSRKRVVSTDASLDMKIAIAKALVSTGAGTLLEASSLIVDGGLNVRNATVENCREALWCLSKFGVEEAKSKWISLVKKRFPLIKHFD